MYGIRYPAGLNFDLLTPDTINTKGQGMKNGKKTF